MGSCSRWVYGLQSRQATLNLGNTVGPLANIGQKRFQITLAGRQNCHLRPCRPADGIHLFLPWRRKLSPRGFQCCTYHWKWWETFGRGVAVLLCIYFKMWCLLRRKDLPATDSVLNDRVRKKMFNTTLFKLKYLCFNVFIFCYCECYWGDASVYVKRESIKCICRESYVSAWES